MKNTLRLLGCTIILLAGCNNAAVQSVATAGAAINDAAEQATLLADLLQRIDMPMQLFKAPADRVSIVTGKKGTVIFVAPDELETESGERPTQEIVVALKELSSTGDMVRANAPTVSDGRLLVSGGSYYVNMTSGGRPLHIRAGGEIKIAFPKASGDGMQLFYGSRDSGKNMNWQPAQPLTSGNSYTLDKPGSKSIMVYDERYHLMGYVGNDSTYARDTARLNNMRRSKRRAELSRARRDDSIYMAQLPREDSIFYARYKVAQRLKETLYDVTGIKRMGWMNVDKFAAYELSSNVTYTVAAKDSISSASVYLIFTGMSSMISTNYYAGPGDHTQSFGKIPTGYSARIIGMAYKNGQLYMSTTDITTADHQNTALTWRKVDEGELARRLERGD